MLRLLLPILFPSWRFFSQIDPSPRIEYGFSQTPTHPHAWHESLPRPESIHWKNSLKRLFYNPEWNEYLYLTTCAEQVLVDASPKKIDEIFQRLYRVLSHSTIGTAENREYLSFRIQLIERQNNHVVTALAFISEPRAVSSLRDIG